MAPPVLATAGMAPPKEPGSAGSGECWKGFGQSLCSPSCSGIHQYKRRPRAVGRNLCNPVSLRGTSGCRGRPLHGRRCCWCRWLNRRGAPETEQPAAASPKLFGFCRVLHSRRRRSGLAAKTCHWAHACSAPDPAAAFHPHFAHGVSGQHKLPIGGLDVDRVAGACAWPSYVAAVAIALWCSDVCSNLASVLRMAKPWVVGQALAHGQTPN